MSQKSVPIHAVILAGGAGTRFWPLSREAYPKPLLQVGGDSTLLEETLDRAWRYADEAWLVCGDDHAKPMTQAAKAAGMSASRVLVEPARRNTAAAIAFAAHRIAQEDPEAVMTILSADHRIPDARAFAAAMRRAAKAASKEDVIVTLGIEPRRPDPTLGYIRIGAEVGSPHRGVHKVSSFVEKPDLKRAKQFISKGGYLWNAGIFICKARVFLEELEANAPEIAAPLADLGKASLRGKAGKAAVHRAYRKAPSEAVDKAIMERSRRVWCLPVKFRWSDVGTWKSLAEELGVDRTVTKVIDGEALLCDSEGNLVRGQGRPVVLLGVSGLAVIDSGDALLIADLDRSGDVGKIPALLRKAGRRDLL